LSPECVCEASAQDWSAVFQLRDMYFRSLSFRTTCHPVLVCLKVVRYQYKGLYPSSAHSQLGPQVNWERVNSSTVWGSLNEPRIWIRCVK